MHKKILIINCEDKGSLLHLDEPQNRFLSSEFIEMVKQKKYDGFYAVTNRDFRNAYHDYIALCHHIDVSHHEHSSHSPFSQEHIEHFKKFSLINNNKNQLLVNKIVKNFSEATGLKCLAVSTPDDASGAGESHEKCGTGFVNILEPFENSHFEKVDFVQQPAHKGLMFTQQMKLVIKHAATQGEVVSIDYFDSNFSRCTVISKMTELPSNVTINQAPLHFVIEGVKQKHHKEKTYLGLKPGSLLSDHGFFHFDDHSSHDEIGYVRMEAKEEDKQEKSQCCVIL